MRLAQSTPSIAAAALAAILSVHCTSASTNLAAPSAGKCRVTAASSPSSYGATGGDGSITISTERDCTWTVAAEAGWVSLKGQTSGQGDATIPYAVAANVVPTPRVGAIVVADSRLQLTQAAAPCRYELSRTADTIGAAGGSLAFTVSTLTGCPWTAASAVNWIAIASPAAGNASGTVGLVVAPNNGGSRAGQVSVGGQGFTVTQLSQEAGPAPGPGPGPGPGPAPAPTPEVVDFEGRVAGVTGQCPTLAFTVSGTRVAIDRDTDIRRGDCRDLSDGDRVRVRGVRRLDGVVAATRIEFRDDEDDD
jgi:hypothetical protein